MTTTIHQFNKQQRLTHILVAAALVCMSVYIFCLFSTIADTVARTHADKAADELSQSISELEFLSIKLKNSLSMEDARVLGFTIVENPTYITRESLGFGGGIVRQ